MPYGKKRVKKLNESQLRRLVRTVIAEQQADSFGGKWTLPQQKQTEMKKALQDQQLWFRVDWEPMLNKHPTGNYIGWQVMPLPNGNSGVIEFYYDDDYQDYMVAIQDFITEQNFYPRSSFETAEEAVRALKKGLEQFDFNLI